MARCTLLSEIDKSLPKQIFAERICTDEILWTYVRTDSFSDALEVLAFVEDLILNTLKKHLDKKGEIEYFKVSGGYVEDSGVSMGTILGGFVIRVLCYKHDTQLITRCFLRKLRGAYVLSLYVDFEEDTPWLRYIVDYRKVFK